MSESHPTSAPAPGKPAKPDKPYPEFSLFRHASGQWAKKIRGKLHYFGKDPDAALAKYLEQKDALHAGRTPRPDPGELTVKGLANAFLNYKAALLKAGELSPRTWDDYKRVCDLLVSHFGKTRLVSDLAPSDFAGLRNRMAERWGPARLGNTIKYIRTAFRYAADSELISAPVRFGPSFRPPSRKVMRIHKAEQGHKLFTRGEVLRLLDAAGPQLRAMILLGINAGLGNSDCGNLPLSAVNLDTGWLDYPRPKTGLTRRCPLWPETVEALRAVLATGPLAKTEAAAGRVFVTAMGDSWAKATSETPLSKEFLKLLRKLGINGRKGLGFYTLRHTFRTVADEAKDQPAADYIMGHEVPHMSSVYRETISDARLKAVTDHVRKWLFAEPPESAPSAGGEPAQQEEPQVVPGFAGQ
jgi:integrase